MADPHWTAYVGMAAGILGAVTGISGAVMGFVSYRRSNAIKALDLRLELRKVVNDIETGLSALPQMLDRAHQSRQRVTAATGQTGALQAWTQQLDQDRAKLSELKERAPSASQELEKRSPVDLESRLVAAHKLHREMTNLAEKYAKALDADDEERKQLREDMRSWTRNAR